MTQYVSERDFPAAYITGVFHPDTPHGTQPWMAWLEEHFVEGKIDAPDEAVESEFDGTGTTSWWQGDEGIYGAQPAFGGYYFIPTADIAAMPDFPIAPEEDDDER